MRDILKNRIAALLEFDAMTDANDNAESISVSDGTVNERFHYDPYGSGPAFSLGDGDSADDNWKFTFQGGRIDTEEMKRVTYLVFRNYGTTKSDANLQVRFLCRKLECFWTDLIAIRSPSLRSRGTRSRMRITT